MTRSEAMHLAKEIDKMNYNGKYDDCQELVEKIYHDFEEGIDKALKIAEENGYHDAYDLLMDIKENR